MKIIKYYFSNIMIIILGIFLQQSHKWNKKKWALKHDIGPIFYTLNK